MHLQLTYNHSEQFTYDATSNISGLAIEVTYVQAPYNSQNYNRYSYCLNNPLKYTDPDGEWIHILVGAIIGSVVGTFTANIKSIKNGDNFWKMQWKGLAAGIVGGAVGAATAATGGAAAAHFGTTGFIAGAATGATTGAVGGALGGASNAWLNGANFRDGFMAGMQGLWAGAATGFVTGGIGGGIDAFIHNKNVWTGDEVAMGRSQFAFSNTDKSANAYQINGSEHGKVEHIKNHEYIMNEDKPRRLWGNKLDKNGLSTGEISKYNNYTIENKDYHIFQDFKGRAYMKLVDQGTFDVQFVLDGKIITPDINGLYHISQGSRILQISLTKQSTFEGTNVISPLKFVIQGFNRNY